MKQSITMWRHGGRRAATLVAPPGVQLQRYEQTPRFPRAAASRDFDPLPRMAAIYGIAELCGVGHRKAIRLAEERLEHRDPGTRQASVQLLEKVATSDLQE